MTQRDTKKLVQEWLRNEKLLGKDILDVDLAVVDKIFGQTPFHTETGQTHPTSEVSTSKKNELFEYRKTVMGCKKCGLHKTRNNLVFGDGNPGSKLMFVGEAPGRNEDRMGRPFVGEAGKLLTQLIKSIGLERKDVYITNIVKCRPPGNRDPLPEEIGKCRGWLVGQLEIMKPKVICTLGRYATYSLIEELRDLSLSFSQVRGKTYEYRGIRVIPTYHPAALLYHPGWRKAVDEDLKVVKELLDEEG